MMAKPGQSLSFMATVSSPSTGALVDADALPTGVLYKNSVATAETVTIVNAATGKYSVSVTVPSSWTSSDVGSVMINATIGGLSYASVACFSVYVADIYHAAVEWTIDGTTDEYTVTWYANGVPQTSGVTNAYIQVIKRADGSDLVAETAMTQIGTTSSYRYNETTNRITEGEAVLAAVKATIDGAVRTWRVPLSRDN